MPKIFIAADHAGFPLKESLKPFLAAGGYEVEDLGAHDLDKEDDYPDYIGPCARRVAEEGAMGIIIGSSGHGEAMVANRVSGIRAAVFYGPSEPQSSFEAEGTIGKDGYDIVRVARLHNDANMLSLGARFISAEEARQAVQTFLTTQFSGVDRHMRRIGKF